MTNIWKLGVATIAVAAATLTAGSAMARRGADDPADHVRQCRGCDDAPGDLRQGRGADDPADHDINDDKGGLRDRGRGADDSADHDANDDRGGDRLRAADDSGRGQGRGRGRGRGGDDAPGDDRGGHGADDPA